MRLFSLILVLLITNPIYAQSNRFKIVGQEVIVSDTSDWVWDVNRRAYFKLRSDFTYLYKFANDELREYTLKELTTPGIIPYWDTPVFHPNYIRQYSPANLRISCIGGG